MSNLSVVRLKRSHFLSFSPYNTISVVCLLIIWWNKHWNYSCFNALLVLAWLCKLTINTGCLILFWGYYVINNFQLKTALIAWSDKFGWKVRLAEVLLASYTFKPLTFSLSFYFSLHFLYSRRKKIILFQTVYKLHVYSISSCCSSALKYVLLWLHCRCFSYMI